MGDKSKQRRAVSAGCGMLVALCACGVHQLLELWGLNKLCVQPDEQGSHNQRMAWSKTVQIKEVVLILYAYEEQLCADGPMPTTMHPASAARRIDPCCSWIDLYDCCLATGTDAKYTHSALY
jgi:hypothetical protein